MDDDEWLAKVSPNKPEWQYHEICLWLPHKPETVEDIANDMVANGFRIDRAIATHEGKILDGRHRYEAALKVGVDPIFTEFQGTKGEAIAYVTSENVARRHLNNSEKEYFYVKRADALGVRTRADNQHVTNVTSTPSQEDHADSLGVRRETVNRWERDRKEIKSDPELAAKSTTPQGYQEAKKEVQKRRKATKEEANKIAKLKSLGERSGAESSNVDKKLDKYREQGVDVDAVESEGEKDRAREKYRGQQRPLEEMANEIAKILIDSKDYDFVASLARAAYPKPGELEHAYNIIKAEGN
jgi:transcriptional regulator with XRE-family HTH domain